MSTPRAVRVQCGPDTYDVVIDALWTLGPLAVSEEAGPDGATVLTAGFADGVQARTAIARLAHFHPVPVAEPDEDWVRSWRQGATPHRTGGFRVRLPEHRQEAQGVDLIIEPGTTFGFGHASTRLALELLGAAPPTGRTVADVGCGSGVLAVAAARLRASSVDAVDVDPDAVAATRANAQRNGVTVRVFMGSTDSLALDAYDLMLCNVTARTQQGLASSLASRLAPGGAVVLSGLLDRQVGAVVDSWSVVAGHLGVARVAADGEWRAVYLA